MKNLFFTSSGRIARRHYWLAMLTYAGIGAVAALVVNMLHAQFPTLVLWDGEANVLSIPTLTVALPLLGCVVLLTWSAICVNAKRCHDRGRSGWFQLVQLIPTVGPIWYLVELGFRRGTPGPNRFGADPLGTVAPVVPLTATA